MTRTYWLNTGSIFASAALLTTIAIGFQKPIETSYSAEQANSALIFQKHSNPNQSETSIDYISFSLSRNVAQQAFRNPTVDLATDLAAGHAENLLFGFLPKWLPIALGGIAIIVCALGAKE